MAMVVVVDCPGFADAGFVSVPGSVKFCATVSATVVCGASAPDVPVIVTVAVAPGAVAFAVSVITVLVVDDVGLNVAVTPVGRPVAAKVTVPANPFWGATVIVLVPPEAPGTIDTLVGLAVSVNVAGPVTVNAIVVVAVRAPDVPLMVPVAVPAAAEAPAVSVITLLEADEVGLKAAVTP